MSKGFSGPWLPWFHGDFLAATQGWNITERGVYFLLLGASWEMGPLPDDRRRLAGIVGAQLEDFDEAWKVVRPKFEVTEAGLVNRRLEQHREKQALRSEKARQSVSNRWQNRLPLNTNVDTFDDTNAHTSAYTLDDTSGHTESIRSGYSSELRTQNSEKDKSSRRPTAVVPQAFHAEVIKAYHECCPGLPQIKSWPKHRMAKLNARIRERMSDGKPANTSEYWQAFFQSVAASDFLSGRTAKPFLATIDWMLGPENFPKIVEGNFENRRSANGANHG